MIPLEPLDQLTLVIAAFFTSTISGVLGMAGGIMLMAIMALFIPAQNILIPVHGVAQLGSNFSRTLFSFKTVKWGIVAPFAIGAVIGGTIGGNVDIVLDEGLFRLILGGFILFFTWAPKLKSMPEIANRATRFGVLGSIASFLALIIGATGPLIAPFYLRENLKKEELVATKAGCQVFVHSAKLIVYGLAGFAFVEYIWLLAGMVVAVF